MVTIHTTKFDLLTRSVNKRAGLLARQPSYGVRSLNLLAPSAHRSSLQIELSKFMLLINRNERSSSPVVGEEKEWTKKLLKQHNFKQMAVVMAGKCLLQSVRPPRQALETRFRNVWRCWPSDASPLGRRFVSPRYKLAVCLTQCVTRRNFSHKPKCT